MIESTTYAERRSAPDTHTLALALAALEQMESRCADRGTDAAQ